MSESRSGTGQAGLSYQAAGVDIAAGNRLVEALKPLAAATARAGAGAELGGFGGLFDLKAAGYRDPLLVAATDGVGTKLLLGLAAGRLAGLGIDLVAMSVNDLLAQGAEPLLFLDYFATGRLDQDQALAVLSGVAEGCRQAGCALVGGETAEMPGLYAPGHFDLAGFALGAVERDRVLTGTGVAPGDRLLGLASDGAHANGFSLIRRILEASGADLAAPPPFDHPAPSLAEALLAPTRIYVRPVLDAMAKRPGAVKALAHITGGGLTENLPRALAPGSAARIDAGAWPRPALFAWLAEAGRLPAEEMWRTFNCGLGLVLIVAAEAEAALAADLEASGERVHRLGALVQRDAGAPALIIDGGDAAWPGARQRS